MTQQQGEVVADLQFAGIVDALGNRRVDDVLLTLQNGEDLSVSEIAGIVGWSEAKVKIRAFRAREALRRQAARLVRPRKAENE